MVENTLPDRTDTKKTHHTEKPVQQPRPAEFAVHI